MVTILSFLFVFSLVVFVHEQGHFWAARACGIRIDTFSLGFGKTLASWRDSHGTTWRIAAIPLGGYVKFFGDASAASNPDADHLTAIRDEIEAKHGREAVESCYHFKPVWQRAIVVAAGPAANFALAIVIFSLMAAAFGNSGVAARIGSVAPDSPAERAGFVRGDLVEAINGRPIHLFGDIQRHVFLAGGDDTAFTVDRDGAKIELTATLGRRTATDPFGGEATTGFLGVSAGVPAILGVPVADTPAAAAGFEAGDRITAINGQVVDYFADLQLYLADASAGPITVTVERDERAVTLRPVLETREIEGADGEVVEMVVFGLTRSRDAGLIVNRFGPVGSVAQGFQTTWQTLVAPVRYISRVVTGRESGRELGGVLRIGKLAGALAEGAYEAKADNGVLAGLGNAIVALIMLAGMLSVSIGLLNLLPIPVLDGGHLVYYAYEAVVGRPLGEGAQEWGFRIGLALVLGLMVFATWNDLRYLRVFETIGNMLS